MDLYNQKSYKFGLTLGNAPVLWYSIG